MKKCWYAACLAGVVLALSVNALARAAEKTPPASPPAADPRLIEAVMCEGLDGATPENPGVVFSVSRGQVACFSRFDHVTSRTVIYHRYYFRDRLTAAVKLYLRSPAWSTYSTIQLREADIGPWRVDITDEDGNVFRTLRFSVSE